MSIEHNKAVVRRWLLEGFNNLDFSAIEECLTEDYINHGTTDTRGYEAGRQVLEQNQGESEIVLESMVAEGNTVMVLFNAEVPIPESDERASFLMVDVFKFRDGKICEAWVIRDRLEVQEKLGVVVGISASK